MQVPGIKTSVVYYHLARSSPGASCCLSLGLATTAVTGSRGDMGPDHHH